MAKRRRQTVEVVQDEADIVPVKIMAKAIADIGAGTRKMLNAGLKQKAIVVLLHDATGINKTTITAVLDGLSEIDRTYLKEPTK